MPIGIFFFFGVCLKINCEVKTITTIYSEERSVYFFKLHFMTPLSSRHLEIIDQDGWTENMFWLQYNKTFRFKSARASIVEG